MNRYLFIGGHVDEEVCFGGTIIKLIQQGHTVEYFTTSIGTSNDSEFIKSCDIMGCVFHVFLTETAQELANYLFKMRDDFDCVFTHSVNDRHPVHRMVAEESRRIFNRNLITYLAPWNGHNNENYFVELSEEHLQKKIQALACYKSQAHRSYMRPDFIRAQAVYNGVKIGKPFAEAFRVQRLIV